MSKLRMLATSVCSLLLVAGCSMGRPAYGVAGKPQLFENLGSYEYPVTTDSPEAQQYFNQGLTWMYSFNHDEAVRSFTRATELDPGCAMAWWGIAYAQGPNYNDTEMSAGRASAAWKALKKAEAALDNETERERDMVAALANRYAEKPPSDRIEVNRAFADAMQSLFEKYPDDVEVGTIYADAMMIQHPWMLYHTDGSPARDETHAIVRTLEQVLKNKPDHPGANHLLIHALEPSNEKERGIAAADRLSDLVPASGHMRHMPSHIYAQVGMWDRSIESNQLAMQSDHAYRKLSPKQGAQSFYMAHNSHMLAFSAMMVGQEKEAMRAARDIWENVPSGPFSGLLKCGVYDVHKRFGRWEELLDEPGPGPSPLAAAVWHSHRAVAYAALQEINKAKAEQKKMRSKIRMIAQFVPDDFMGFAMKFLLASDSFVAGEIALHEGELDDAAGHLEQAVMLEDTLGYGEPPRWLQPARHTLGVIYLKSGRFADAERVYQEDLDKWPRNGWALLGLAQACEAQGRMSDAVAMRAEFEKVWKGADEPLQTSCKCVKTLASK